MDRVEYRKTPDGRLVPVQDQRQFLLILGIVVAFVLVLGGGVTYLALHRPHVSGLSPSLAAETFVRQQLSASKPDRLHFAPQEEINVRSLGNGRFIVTGWVDTISAGGENQRIDFSCTLLQNPHGDWANEQLNLFPES